jgi:hypothetical protein
MMTSKGEPMSRYRALSIFRVRYAAAFTVAALLASAPLAQAQPAGPEPSGLSISVDDHRPLSALASELQKRYQVVVTYEEGPWGADDDVEDVTEAFIRTNGPGKALPAKPVMVPRRMAVTFEYALDPSKSGSTDYLDLLSAMLKQYEAQGGPGKFRVEGRNGIYHLIPASLKDAKSQWADVSPVFSTPVKLADEERTVLATLDAIVAQLNASSAAKIGWGYVPLNLFNQTHIRIAADGVPAREVLHQILERLPSRASWLLNYDPTTKKYYLSFLLLPGERKESERTPAPR